MYLQIQSGIRGRQIVHRSKSMLFTESGLLMLGRIQESALVLGVRLLQSVTKDASVCFRRCPLLISRFIFSLKMYVFRLKMYVFKLKMYVFKLKMYIFSLKINLEVCLIQPSRQTEPAL